MFTFKTDLPASVSVKTFFLQNVQYIMLLTCLNTLSSVRENIFDLLSALFLFISVKWSKVPSKEHYGNFDLL